MKNITLALLFVVILSGCKKSSTAPAPQPVPSTTLRLSTTRTLNPNGHYILQTNTYLENGLLAKEVSKDESTGLSVTQEYFYVNQIPEYSIISNDNRRVSRINYSFVNGRLIKMDYLEYDQFGNSSLNFSRTLEYSGNLLSKTTTFSVQNKPLYYEIYSFLGENLLAVRTYSADGVVQNLTEYLYDMELNPYKGNLDKYQLALGLSKNNVTRVRYTDYNNPAASSDRRYEYEYNSEKYPIKKSFIGPTNRELQVTFTYQSYKVN